MKFYRNNKNNNYFLFKIDISKLNAVYSYKYYYVSFFKNGKEHNSKNASFINNSGEKSFRLNEIWYGSHNDFTKQSWRKFFKLQTFL
jgi:hypothetical protein